MNWEAQLLKFEQSKDGRFPALSPTYTDAVVSPGALIATSIFNIAKLFYL